MEESALLKFTIYPANTYIEPDTKETRELIDSFTAFHPHGYQYSKKYRQGYWDGLYRFRRRNKIPTGLYLTLVKEKLKEQSINYTEKFEFSYIKPKQDYNLKGIELRDYQIDVIEQALKEKRCIIKLPTNAGKTETVFALIQAFDQPFLFVTHRKELFYQTYERILDRTDLRPGLVGDGNRDYNFKDGMIIMVQTFSKLDKENKEKLLSVPVLVLDECHHFSGSGEGDWYKLLSKSSSVIRYGLSATPLRNDEVRDWMLRSLTGKIIGDITNEYLIQEGYSTPPEIHMIQIKNDVSEEEIKRKYKAQIRAVVIKHEKLKKSLDNEEASGRIQQTMESVLKKIKMKQYRETYTKFVVEDEARYRVIKKIADKHQGQQVLILCDRVNQGYRIRDMIDNCIFLHGSDKVDFRRNVISGFKKGDINILVTTLLDEGIDISNIQVLMFASPMVSIVKVLQRLGRGMRKDKNKEKIIIYDLVDNSDYFKKQAIERRKIYENEKFKVV